MVRELLESQKIKASGVSSALSVKPGRSSSHLPEKLKIKNVIIALKTLATEFRDGGKMEDNIEEMTSFFFCRYVVTRTGKLCMPVEGKIPWIPREYLRPMEDPLLAVGDGEKYDEFFGSILRTKDISWIRGRII